MASPYRKVFKPKCGFEDVRRSADGQLHCAVCQRQFDEDFVEMIRSSVPLAEFKAFLVRLNVSHP